MDDNDPVMKMYEAQAIAIKQQRELEERIRELEEARREIERLRAQQIHLREAIAKMEQNFNAKFENIHLQFSNLQQAFDEKTVENLQLQETIAGINRRIEELAAELRAESEQRIRISNKFDGVCSELNLYVSVILFGGYCNDDEIDSICLYNSKENKWINSPLKLPDTLERHGSAILNDEIYIFGGYNGKELESTYKLGENGEWIKLADMNMERSYFGSLVFDDEIWVFGGFGSDIRTRLRTVEKYNPQTNSWTFMAQMNQAKHSFAVSIINGKFYVSGGWSGKYLHKIEVFDPKKNKWEFFCNMPYGSENHTSTVDGTNLIIIGGQKFGYKRSNEVWKIDVMDPEKEWKQMPNLQQKRFGHNAVKLMDGLMVIGGWINREGTETDSVEIFDGQKWKEGPKLPETRSVFSSIPLTSKNEKKFLQLFF